MNRQCNIKEKIRICCIAFIITELKSFVSSIKYGSDMLFIEDKFNSSSDYGSDETFTINTEGCFISPVISRPYVRDHLFPNSQPCRNHQHPLLISNYTHIMVVNKNLKYYYSNVSEKYVKCCYTSFFRPRSSYHMSNEDVNNTMKYSSCVMFRHVIKVRNEFVKVKCYNKDEIIYNQFFVFTPKKTFTPYRSDPFSSDQLRYNVILLGLGSISRQNFYKSMPKTWNLLKYNNAVELTGYNTVAADTFQNLIALLLGMNSSQLHNTCWPSRRTTFDSCPFIWERFKDVGYYTALAEDTPNFGIFNTHKFGFRGKPTDYYVNPFIQESETLIENAKEYSLCMGDQYYFEILLKYVESLTTQLSDLKLFGLFWETSLSHDKLKYPNKMDDAYATLIQNLESSGYLNKTILIVFSDHGMQDSNIGLSERIRLELILPFVSILVPNTFRKKYRLAYSNLRMNEKRLTTPYDLHETLIDLLELSDITDDEITKRSKEAYGQNREMSLFLPIPLNRTCDMADIDNQWCGCFKHIEMSANSTLVMEATQFLSQQINDVLKPYPRCFKLVITNIIKAYKIVPSNKETADWYFIKMIVNTMPGGAVLEAVLQLTYYWNIVKPIKRLNNSYRNYCVDNENIKLLCYCKPEYSYNYN